MGLAQSRKAISVLGFFTGVFYIVRKVRLFTAAATVALLLSAPVHAAERGTPDEAKALLARAVEHVAKAGETQALADFSDPKGAFVDRDLYIACIGPDNRTSAHGGNAKIIGKDMSDIKDADGKLFGKEMMDIGRTRGEGQLAYKWVNPVTKKIEPKTMFVRAAGKHVCAVGSYQQ